MLWQRFFKTFVWDLSSEFAKQKIKIFVAREIQYFEIGIFSFNSYVYYLTRGFIAPTQAFNLLARAFNLATRAFDLATRSFSLLIRGFELVTGGFELVTRELELVTGGFELITRELELVTHGFEFVTRELELVTRRFELATRGFELVTRKSYFTFPPGGVPWGKVFLEISQNSQENTCARVSILTMLQGSDLNTHSNLE